MFLLFLFVKLIAIHSILNIIKKKRTNSLLFIISFLEGTTRDQDDAVKEEKPHADAETSPAATPVQVHLLISFFVYVFLFQIE